MNGTVFLSAVIFLSAALCCPALADGYDPSLYAFNDMPEKCNTVCCHTKIKNAVMADLSPDDPECIWHFKMMYKDRPREIKDVIGRIDYTKEIDGIKYYYFGVASENKGNLIRVDADGSYIRNLKYPVFSFIFLNVELFPHIKYLKWPMLAGDVWECDSEGTIDILSIFKIRMKTNAKFRVAAVEDVECDGRIMHVWKVENDVVRGSDGKVFREMNWFAAGVGLIYIDSEALTFELQKYVPGPTNQKRFLELTEPANKR